MKIDSFSTTNSQYRHNIKPKGIQGQGFDKKLNDMTNFSLNQNMIQVAGFEKNSLGNTDKFFISTHNSNSIKTNDTASMIETAKKAVINDIIPKTDPEQIQRIKEQIETGTYEIDVKEIARKVIEFYGVSK